ncbi:MAG: succinate dehydrogenase assembly factor 2 [Hyphomicrobiaceae bacterium]|nr:succinate dehydrogenase assembly factor 2 [Hyphomicrobiaceae bacterium]
MSDDVERRRRRALYRACHRGTKEMDWILGRFAEAEVAGMPEQTLSDFERLLALPDPDIQSWVLAPERLEMSELAPLIDKLRTFHGL